MMIEVRAYIQNLLSTYEKLIQMGSQVQGNYAFCDYLYQPKFSSKFDLNKEFIRIRAYQMTNWNHKDVELVHKVKSIPHVIGLAKIKKEFDKFEDALAFLGYDYEEAFCFQREGREYKLNNLRLFVENIENLPASIEVISPSQEELTWVFEQINPIEIIYDSVPKLIEMVKEKEKILGSVQNLSNHV